MPIVGRFGSLAALRYRISPTAASGCILALQLSIFHFANLNVCFHQKRSFKSCENQRNEGQLTANSGHRHVKRSAVQDAGYRFLPGRVTDALYLAEKITFAQVEAAVSQKVVGGRHMKIEIRQHKSQQIALAGKIYNVTPKL